jgi:hypothetical protein
MWLIDTSLRQIRWRITSPSKSTSHICRVRLSLCSSKKTLTMSMQKSMAMGKQRKVNLYRRSSWHSNLFLILAKATSNCSQSSPVVGNPLVPHEVKWHKTCALSNHRETVLSSSRFSFNSNLHLPRCKSKVAYLYSTRNQQPP